MSREFQELLFEPFTRERRDEAERRHGSGLGLAITQNIVQQLGGSIAVTSAIGEGTKVKVHLDLPLVDIQPQKEVARGGGSRQAFAALGGSGCFSRRIIRSMLRLRGSFWSAGAWKSSVRKMDGRRWSFLWRGKSIISMRSDGYCDAEDGRF